MQENERANLFIDNHKTIEDLKIALTQYFLQLFIAGNYGEECIQSCLLLGEAHKKISLPVGVYLVTYSHCFMLTRPHIFEYIDGENGTFKAFYAVAKLITLDEMVSISAYI